MFNNLKIGTRLMSLLILVLLLMATLTGVAMRNIDNSGRDLAATYEEKLQPIRLSSRIQGLLDDTRSQLMLGLQHNPRSELSRLHDHPLSLHLEFIDKSLAEANAAWQELAGSARQIPADEKVLLDEFDKAMQAYISEGLAPSLKALSSEQYDQANVELLMKTNPRNNALRASAAKLSDYYAQSAKQLYQESLVRQTNATLLMIGTGLLATILAIGLGLWIIRSITRPINAAVVAATRMADGDLTVHLESSSKDEVGQLMNAMQNMIAKLTQIISEVRTAADNLTNAAGQVSATAQSLSQSSSEQAASVEETTSSMEQMTASISQNTENAKVTDGMASKAAQEAAEGGEAVSKTVDDMKSIASKIGIIDDIAYQTNLLALNAAIEAARAGDHGKGFAVVAAEVRKLAERSQVAAQEIGGLASSSVKQAERAGSLLTEMVPTIRKTSDLVQEIASASSEQSSGVAQINDAMGQLNQATQQNASASEELAATAEELGSQAEQLQQTMTFFRLDDNGRSAARRVT